MCAWTAPRLWVAEEVVTAAILNVALRDNLLFLSTHAHGGAAGAGNDELSGVDSIAFDDLAASPDAAGELQRNGVNLEWYGAAVVKFTEADAAAATASPRTLGTGALQGAPGNHGHNYSAHTVSNISATAATAGGTHEHSKSQYSLVNTVTTTIHSTTTTKRIGAFAMDVVALINHASGVTLKASIEADGVEVVSTTNAYNGTTAPEMLLAVVVKPTADIAFVSKIARSGTAGTSEAELMAIGSGGGSGGGTTTNPTGVLAQADLGAA